MDSIDTIHFSTVSFDIQTLKQWKNTLQKIRTLLIVIVTPFLFSCASNSISNVRNLVDGSKIIVLSSMGSDINLYFVGTTVFSNKKKSYNFSEWQIDNYIEQETYRLIENSRFSVADYSNEGIFPLFEEDLFSGKIDFKGAEAEVESVAAATGADIILIVHPVKRGDPFFKTNQSIQGIGYYERSRFGEVETISYVYFGVTLYDARLMKKLVGRAKWQSADNYVTYAELARDEVSLDEKTFKQLALLNIKNILEQLSVN